MIINQGKTYLKLFALKYLKRGAKHAGWGDERAYAEVGRSRFWNWEIPGWSPDVCWEWCVVRLQNATRRVMIVACCCLNFKIWNLENLPAPTKYIVYENTYYYVPANINFETFKNIVFVLVQVNFFQTQTYIVLGILPLVW